MVCQSIKVFLFLVIPQVLLEGRVKVLEPGVRLERENILFSWSYNIFTSNLVLIWYAREARVGTDCQKLSIGVTCCQKILFQAVWNSKEPCPRGLPWVSTLCGKLCGWHLAGWCCSSLNPHRNYQGSLEPRFRLCRNHRGKILSCRVVTPQIALRLQRI